MIDAQAQRCIYAGAIQLLASMNPTTTQQESAMDAAVNAAVEVWNKVESFAEGAPAQAEVFNPPSDGKKTINYMDPNEIQESGPISQQDLIDGGFIPPKAEKSA